MKQFPRYIFVFSIRLTISYTYSMYNTVTMKITGPRTVASKTHVGPVNLLYIVGLAQDCSNSIFGHFDKNW